MIKNDENQSRKAKSCSVSLQGSDNIAINKNQNLLIDIEECNNSKSEVHNFL